MHHALNLRSRVFRCLLVLALLAWAALAFNAFAQPLAMTAGGHAQTAMTMGGTAAVRCDGTMRGHPSPVSHPAGNGHGCCQHGGCWCASLCSGIVDVPYLDMEMQPTHAFAFPLIYAQPVRALSAQPLRPPIA